MKTLELIKQLTSIASPTGNTFVIIDWIKDYLSKIGYNSQITRKGSLLVTVPGQDDQSHRFVTAHVDTLGAMVRAIKPDGRLKLALIGGFRFNAIEGEYCQISTQDGKQISGTILMHQTSVHVYADAGTAERNQDNMEIRLDAKTRSAQETRELGIEVGDFISFDARAQITDSGFIKSRHLDDKVSVALLLEFLADIQQRQITLPYTTHFLFSNNEEIGYGGNSSIDARVIDYLAVDMGAMGDDQQTDEYSVSICAKDSSGPYHLGLRNQLVALAKQHNIPYQLDIYPFYGSDASAAMRAGHDVRHALIGAGIDASHAYERTHIESVQATGQLLARYILAPLLPHQA